MSIDGMQKTKDSDPRSGCGGFLLVGLVRGTDITALQGSTSEDLCARPSITRPELDMEVLTCLKMLGPLKMD